MGVLPKQVWQKQFQVDDRNRIEFKLTLLLVHHNNVLILVDTGIGNRIDEKLQRIYSPSDCHLFTALNEAGVSPEQIDYVLLTHLHFDHAGGIVTNIVNPQLTFPNAVHLIQKAEWEISENPDLLNAAAYNFSQNLKLLKDKGKYQLLDGDTEIVPGFTAKLWKGHSHGMQGVRIFSDNRALHYPADIIPCQTHLNLPVTSAYDVNRNDTFLAKQEIIEDVITNKGIIVFNHDTVNNSIKWDDIPRKTK